MDFASNLVSSIAILIALIGLSAALRRFGVVRAEDGKLFASLVTHVTLPALIFHALAANPLQWHFTELSVAMVLAELGCLAAAWAVGRRLGLAKPQTGVLLRFQNLRAMVPVLLAACVIKLGIQPAMAWLPSYFLGISVDAQRVLIVEAGMPTATLAVVFADRYGCDSAMASVVLCVTTILSPLSLLALMSVL